MSKYLMKSAAAIVLGLAAAACSHDLDIVEKAEQQSLDNAQATLGFYIPENQDWKMSSEASINVAIPGDANQTYTVMVFANNPLEDGIGYYLTKQTLKGGQNLATDVSYPMHLTSLVIGITDSNDVTTYKSASVVDGKITSLDNESAVKTRAYTPTDNNYTLTNQSANNPTPPVQPIFRDKSTITEPTIPTDYYNTEDEITAAKLGFAKDVTSDGASSYVNSSNTGITDKKNQIIYIVGDVTLQSNPGTGSIFVVTQNSKLTISGFGQYVSVYLASKAKLDVSNTTSLVSFDGANLYMNSGSEVSASSLRFFNGSQVKNASGTITATNLCVDMNSTLWNEGTVTVSNELKGMNEHAYIYNAAGKTIKTKDLSLINNYDFLYNDGTLNVSGDIKLTNTSAELVNNNTLTAGSLDMSAGGNMYNTTNGTTTIYGMSYVTSNNYNGTQWMNDGVYTSGDFYVKNIDKVYNNCMLTITSNNKGGTGMFTFGGGEHCSFVLNGNASVRTDKMSWGNNADFYMNNNSMLEVLGECKSYNPNKNHGLHGLGTGYSIFKAASVTYNEKQQNCMNYYGNVWVDTDHHFKQEFLDKDKLETSDQPTYYFNTTNRTVKFKFFDDPCPITSSINAGKCHHGYEPPKPPVIPGEPEVWSYAFEDNSASCDFDMNDVVLRVNINKYNEDKLDVTLVAAGCEYDNYVFLGDDPNPIKWNGKAEVHDALGAAKGQMVNTGRGVSKTPVTVTIDKNGYDPAKAPFKIWPYKKNGDYGVVADQKESSPIPVTQLQGSGKAPLGIIVPGKWAWPTERTVIVEAYSQFVQWASETDEHVRVQKSDWYNYPTSGKVVVQ